MQSMTLPLIQRDSRPISIFKAEDTHMATKGSKTSKTETPNIDQLNHKTELEQAQAERKALAARIKKIKAQRKAERLHERDAELSNVVATRLAGRVKSHIKAGETQEQAIEAVFAQYRAAVVQRLSDTEGEQTCASCGGAIDLDGECVNACASSRTAELPSSAFAVES